MDNADSERHKRRREVYLLGTGVILGILAQSLYDLIKAILTHDISTEYTDFFAGVIAFILLYGALRIGLGGDGKDHPTKVNTQKSPP